MRAVTSTVPFVSTLSPRLALMPGRTPALGACRVAITRFVAVYGGFAAKFRAALRGRPPQNA